LAGSGDESHGLATGVIARQSWHRHLPYGDGCAAVGGGVTPHGKAPQLRESLSVRDASSPS